MSHTTTTATAAAPRRSPAQWAIVAALAILGILALVAAILFITRAANSIHFLSGSVHHGHHLIRLTVSLVAAALLLAAAGYFIRTTSKSLARRGTALARAAAAWAGRSPTAPPVQFVPFSRDLRCAGRLHFRSPTRVTAKGLAWRRENSDDASALLSAVGGAASAVCQGGRDS